MERIRIRLWWLWLRLFHQPVTVIEPSEMPPFRWNLAGGCDDPEIARRRATALLDPDPKQYAAMYDQAVQDLADLLSALARGERPS